VRTLCDAKTLACGDARTSFSATHLNDRETFPVEKRAAKVPMQYLAAARDLDKKFHKSQRGKVRPIESKLLEFGAKDGPKPHTVVGFVLGAFDELSNSCYSLCRAIARVGAARVVSFWKMPPKHALALCKQKILRFWGLTAQGGWARLILGRFHDLVLSPGDSAAAKREPESVSHFANLFLRNRRGARRRGGGLGSENDGHDDGRYDNGGSGERVRRAEAAGAAFCAAQTRPRARGRGSDRGSNDERSSGGRVRRAVSKAGPG
jgi:hypothetical protein